MRQIWPLLTFLKNVETIENSAFSYARNLNSVTFETGSILESIGDSAFYSTFHYSTSDLTTIAIPASVKSIGNYAFGNTTYLASVTFETGSKLEIIGDNAFYAASSLTTIAIPAKVQTIGDNAFYRATNLASVTIPSNVTRILQNAFADTILNVVYISDITTFNTNNDTNFQYNTLITNFYGATNVTINLSTTVTTFTYSDSTTSTSLDKSLTNLSYTIPDGQSLTGVNIGTKVVSIGNDVFRGATSLSSVTFDPNSQLTSIGAVAFYGTTSLISIIIPASVITIGNGVFQEATSLSSVTFEPNSQLTSLAGAVFFNASSLTSFTIPPSVTSIGGFVFNGTGIADVLYNESSTMLVYYPGSITNASFTIPDSVTSIVSAAFWNASSLTLITIPAKITTIGEFPFYGTGIANVLYNDNQTRLVYYPKSLTNASFTIPSSVTSIESGAFYDVSNLTSIIIHNNVTTIGDIAFQECTSLNSISTMPTSIAKIGSRAFQNTIITEILFMDDEYSNVTSSSFNSDAFSDSNITSFTMTEAVANTLGVTFSTNDDGDYGAFGVSFYGLASVDIYSLVQ